MYQTAQRIFLKRDICLHSINCFTMQHALPANLLRTREREVTLLFGDLRGSTELAASLEMDRLVCEMIGHVMDCFTEAVLDYRGTVVDYCGDGIVAMWNAPTDQPRHAELACRAGLQMLDNLRDVTGDWIGVSQCELRLGIGLHTGTVHVGNAGSTHQAKYGPRGPNVHVASRVEAATKEVGVPLVATKSTVEQLPGNLFANRVCRAQLPGLREPIELYALRSRPDEARVTAAWRAYHQALGQFEANRLQDAAELLASIDRNTAAVPWRFLEQQIQRDLGRSQRRRSTDPPMAGNGVIALVGK